eukprot:3601804-Pyramimonas_sp.AAC.1
MVRSRNRQCPRRWWTGSRRRLVLPEDRVTVDVGDVLEVPSPLNCPYSFIHAEQIELMLMAFTAAVVTVGADGRRVDHAVVGLLDGHD